MDPVWLARLQFAITLGYHFIFAPLGIGLAWLNVVLVGRYWRTGDERDKQQARFWIRLFGMSFAVGVATGTAIEFQFGTNWARYSTFVGDVFGPLLAMEVFYAFFIESLFIAILLFGWGRVSRPVLWFSSLLVAIGATSTAFWILSANSFMQTPAGYVIRNGRAELTSFTQALFSPSFLPRFFHTFDAALLTGALFMLGISAWWLLKRPHTYAARAGLALGLAVAFPTAALQLLTGHFHAVQVYYTQPVKLAAFEGLFTTQRYAPYVFFGYPDVKTRTVRGAIRIPSGLSLLTQFRPDAKVTGLDSVPQRYWPPLLWTFYPFHLMVTLGLYFIAFTALGVFLWWRKLLLHSRWYLWLAWLTIPLPFLSNELGWTAAEVGRQPWIVYGKMLTSDAVSTVVPAGHVLATFIVFIGAYLVLFVIWAVLLRREVKLGVESDQGPAAEKLS